MTPGGTTDTTETTHVVWAAPANEAAARALDRWARGRGVVLLAAEHAKMSATEVVDLRVADDVESLLARARDAIAALDIDGAESALATARDALRAHPELPQAAWLMAEVERGWASRWSRAEPRDEERAAQAWARAASLDGGRVPGVGEIDARAPKRIGARIDLRGDARGATIDLDGTRVPPGLVALAAGDHAIRVTKGGGVVWAAWVGIADGTRVTIDLASPEPCTDVDLNRAHDAASRSAVLCPSWLFASPTPSGVRLARCEGGACGTTVEILDATAARATPLHPREKASAWPTWATWAIVGGAAAVATGLTLYSTGAFDGPSHEARFQNGGLKTSGFAF